MAQTGSIKGKVTDAAGKSLIGARIELMNLADSSQRKFSLAKEDGSYEFNNLKAGNYLGRASYLGYQTTVKRITVNGKGVQSINFNLNTKSDQLKEVTVQGQAITGTQKGDTSVFNANAFKTNPDANAEDLVTKMPGVTMQDGKVQAQGEEVKKVMVDGKPFFGEDPSTVLKNLPAEVIDRIEVFDRKSEQSQFTGFDDGNTTKTFNIITKPSFRNGTFGRVYAGANEVPQYRAGFSINHFKEKRRISLLYQSNNVNEQNFSQEDLLGVMAGSASSGGSSRGRPPGMMVSSRAGGPNFGGNNNSFLVNAQNGINTTHAVGLNYSDMWGKKIEVSGSYFYNYTDNNSITRTDRTLLTGSDVNLKYLEENISTSINQNHRFNLRMDYKIDSFNSITFIPRISYQFNEGQSALVGENLSAGNVLNENKNIQNSDLVGGNISLPLTYRKSFMKKGRTLSLDLNPTWNLQDGNSIVRNSFYSVSDSTFNDTIDQRSTLNKNSLQFNNNVSYTEPLSEASSLIFTYTYNQTNNNSDKLTNQFDELTQDYSDFDTVLSNTFKSIYTQQSMRVGYQYKNKKLTLTLSVAGQYAALENKQVFPVANDLRRSFASILPSGMLMYRFDYKRNLRSFLRVANNAPTVENLQEVLNNTNSANLSIGNANLEQDQQFFHVIRYSSVDPLKGKTFFAVLRTSITQNYIGSSTYIASVDTSINGITLLQGSRLTRPENLDGFYSVNAFLSYGFPIKNIIKSNLSFTWNGGILQTPSMINNQINYAVSPSTSLGINWSSNISKVWDFTISSQTQYSLQTNSTESASDNAFINQQSRVRLNVMPWKGIVFTTEATHNLYEGLSDDFSQNFILWNAGVGYKFMKKEAAEIRITAFDLLNQNNSISRNFTDTYSEDVYTNILQQYFMLNFSYKFSSF
jgi:hypothetical protein